MIRPETISIRKEKYNRENCYEYQGTVVESIPRGNVLRYRVDVNGVLVSADTLFRSFPYLRKALRYGCLWKKEIAWKWRMLYEKVYVQ